MQHASALMAVEDSSGPGQTRAASYSYLQDDEEERLEISSINYFTSFFTLIHI